MLKSRRGVPFDPPMWTYSRQSQFVLMTFSGTVDAEDAFAAAAKLRQDVGTKPVRVVLDITGADFPQRCAWIFMAVLEDVPVIDAVVLGASREANGSFGRVGCAFLVPITFYATSLDWLACERATRSVRPRPPSPLLALTV
jgi:hypothetical protein